MHHYSQDDKHVSHVINRIVDEIDEASRTRAQFYEALGGDADTGYIPPDGRRAVVKLAALLIDPFYEPLNEL